MRKTVSFWMLIIAALAFPLSSCSDDGLNEEIGLSTSPINDLDDDGPDDPENDINVTGNTNSDNIDCTKGNEINTNRAPCNTSLNYSNEISISESGSTRTITANNIPGHMIGTAGPNSVSPQNNTYRITTSPQIASSITYLLGDRGPLYAFGVLLNGVEVDPEAAEPWPHSGSLASSNWEWNLEAMHVRIGLDCNNAHVQPNGQYHYHGSPTLLVESMNISTEEMTLIGYAADGFPIYFKYGYLSSSINGVSELRSSYRLKSGNRPGDGQSAPCGTYNGVYSNDFEYVQGLGDLDECNGRVGATMEYPNGTYYYVITDDFPYIPRCFMGTPSNDFRIGG